MGEAKFDLIWAGCGEWILNVITLWVRPIYRKMIKTEKGRKIAYRLGNVKCTGYLIIGLCLFFLVVFTYTCVGILEISYVLGLSDKLYLFFYEVLISLYLGGIGYILALVNFRWSSYGKISLKEYDHDQNDFYLWFSSPEDFCKYHDGFFKKEKLVHRVLLQMYEKKE